MSAPLTINAAYRVYPAGVSGANAATGLAAPYDRYYWAPQKEEPQPPPEEPPAREAPSGPEGKPPRQNPDLSPKSSSSGAFTLYTPDSATSPNRQVPSPELSSTPQKHKEESAAGKKVKVRTVFSQEQLQILHHRFQNQKYLSPQQIRELACSLGLTYKQIKTWFQNQRMKFKRTQKESMWMKRGMCQPQNGYLDINSSYYSGYTISDARNLHSLASAHENYTSNPTCVQTPSYSNDHGQIYGSPHNFYPIVSGEEGGFFGKAAEACYSQQAIGYISQQKMNLYHGFPASMEYTTVKIEDGYQFSNGSATTPSASILPPYQVPLQTQGPQSSCNS